MKHHFGDWLNRDYDYWTITPNRERWAYRYENLLDAPIEASTLTITKHDLNWERVFDFKNLTELTLHEASKIQLEALKQLKSLTALRISHVRPKTLGFICNQTQLKELVLEYVSGFDDLSPLQKLPNLEALHMENLRRVKNHRGLVGFTELKYLSIYGTLDWNQPIKNLSFLAGLPKLEYLGFGFIKFLSEFPVFKPISLAPKLKEIRLGLNATTLENFAYLEAKFPNIIGAKRLPYRIIEERHQKIRATDIGWSMSKDEFQKLPNGYLSSEGEKLIYESPQLYLLGKGTRYYSGPIEKIMSKCQEHKMKYDKLVKTYSEISV